MGLEEELARAEGPTLVGSLVQSAICGAVIKDGISFFLKFPNDHRHHRIVVGLLMVNSLLAWSIVLAVDWTLYIKAQANPKLLHVPRAPDYWNVSIATPLVAEAIGQFFFAYRAYKFSGRKLWLGIILSLMWLGHLGIALAAIINSGTKAGGLLGNGKPPDLTGDLAAAGLLFGAFFDLCLSCCLAILLQKARKGFNERTDSMLGVFLRMSVTTGTVTSVLATVTAAMATLSTKRVSWGPFQAPFAACLPQVSAYVVIATLHMREANESQHSSKRSFTTSDKAVSYRTGPSNSFAPRKESVVDNSVLARYQLSREVNIDSADPVEIKIASPGGRRQWAGSPVGNYTPSVGSRTLSSDETRPSTTRADRVAAYSPVLQPHRDAFPEHAQSYALDNVPRNYHHQEGYGAHAM